MKMLNQELNENLDLIAEQLQNLRGYL